MRAFFNFSDATPVPLTIICKCDTSNFLHFLNFGSFFAAVVISDACVVLQQGGKVTLETT